MQQHTSKWWFDEVDEDYRGQSASLQPDAVVAGE